MAGLRINLRRTTGGYAAHPVGLPDLRHVLGQVGIPLRTVAPLLLALVLLAATSATALA